MRRLIVGKALTGIPVSEEEDGRQNHQYRIIYVIQGDISLQINLREFNIKAGMLAYIKTGAIMEVTTFNPQAEVLLIGFTETPPTSSFKGYVASRSITPQTEMLLSLIESAATEEPYQKEYTTHLMSALYSFIVSGDYNQEHSSGSRKEELFNRFLTLVENTPQKQPIPYYAEKLHVAPHYLSRIVSEVSGTNVMEWVGRSLTLQAKVMLRSSDKSILDISEELGFATLPFFCRFFKKSTGYTPTEYRKACSSSVV